MPAYLIFGYARSTDAQIGMGLRVCIVNMGIIPNHYQDGDDSVQ
jgi:hypothetical protein